MMIRSIVMVVIRETSPSQSFGYMVMKVTQKTRTGMIATTNIMMIMVGIIQNNLINLISVGLVANDISQ